MHYVVIGAGPAGVTACDTLREQDPQCRITLIGGEPEPPYSRMAIPYVMVEKIEEHGTYLRQNDSHYAEQRIEMVDGPVKRVDPQSRRIVLESGSEVAYDRLLIATGATPLKPPIPGIDLPGVHNCWTMADTRAIVERAKPGSSVVLIGAGFIGCIILEALVMRQVKLTVVEKAPRMVARMMDQVASELLQGWCESKGVDVHTNAGVTSISQQGDGLQLSVDNGETLTADLVITAMGVRANTEFLEGSGIEINDGIVVNSHFQSNFPDIYAAGDVAQGLDFSTGQNQVQAIQPTSVEHGRMAAINMVSDAAVEHRGSLNMNVLDTLGLISSSFGQWMGVDNGEQAVLLDRENYRYLRLEFDGDYLVGASSLGHTQHIGVLRGLIRSRVPLGEWKKRLMKDPTRLMEAYLGCVVSA
ncbi:MAG: FAD-dependent oxidoreductase [Candidatus Thiodiazotropha taylori]|nr:FAD-dependent oxidoreductase [Candidatus Thiodiazotropha taylori]MCG8088055.1 FAD-dependent oxidoreductase [Candidatus Thiodiazotropha taylori]MCW4233655.1 FAD-dependent oxidoreductase [Candidatus Thiodiazotropha taylori]